MNAFCANCPAWHQTGDQATELDKVQGECRINPPTPQLVPVASFTGQNGLQLVGMFPPALSGSYCMRHPDRIAMMEPLKQLPQGGYNRPPTLDEARDLSRKID